MASESDSSQQRMITLRTADNHEFVVEQRVAELSLTLKTLIDDLDDAGFIPITEVDSSIMATIIEYCKRHSLAKPDDDKEAVEEKNALEKFDEDLLGGKDRQTLLDLVLAAHYLNIPELVECLCKKIAPLIQDLPHQEVRLIFGQENDYTPEEELATRNEYAWAFEGFQ